MALEIPGIYLQADGDKFFVFDHVDAEILKRDENGIILIDGASQTPGGDKPFASRRSGFVSRIKRGCVDEITIKLNRALIKVGFRLVLFV